MEEHPVPALHQATEAISHQAGSSWVQADQATAGRSSELQPQKRSWKRHGERPRIETDFGEVETEKNREKTEKNHEEFSESRRIQKNPEEWPEWRDVQT